MACVIADASVLIIFDKIESLSVLREVYSEIYITPEISQEYGKPLPEWIIVETAEDKKYQLFLQTQVDIGEASAIALSVEKDDTLVILDDLKARALAKSLGIKFTGTLGVVNKAKELGVLQKVKPLIERLRDTNFRIADNIIADLLKRNGE